MIDNSPIFRPNMAGLVSCLLKGVQLTNFCSNNLSNTISVLGTLSQVRFKSKVKPKPTRPWTGTNHYNHKALQEWWDWDGCGPYKYRHHHYPNNITLRDVQRRRIFKRLHFERASRENIIDNDILPAEIQDIAGQEIQDLPYDSATWRPNMRCCVTGRARGHYKEYRVSRFIFRAEADHNRVSGVQRAFWLYNTKIEP
ncbi:28S ribosomal protein S14, mitochondrial [Eurytemora carolleeae]|uniref:28S ribosomal protein S14, mitochondrial n=1 Tax=Eurytemora carolleeae TaxID=1294199 RepID=UPI000C7886B1|nr:28S ribosomal protein S14, mitochondrial [Eurytemora carolleeae]|eukprot:XP_023341496.1 28S ribosomal protein S14, mitochondrial-like [Eurytemora affinis]